jgi:Ca2+:H+ antiporter
VNRQRLSPARWIKSWTTTVPVLAVVVLVLTWGRTLPRAVVVIVALVLAGVVLAAVHHAEVVAARVASLSGPSS